MSDRVKTLTDTTYPYAGNDLISTNNNGTPGTRTVVASYDYDAFGNGTTAANDYYNPLRYCGEYLDEETGLIYLRARYYDPSIGRFVSEDPIKDGTNWYVYCNDNPIRYVDRGGKSATEVLNSGIQMAQEVSALNPLPGLEDVAAGAVLIGAGVAAGVVFVYDAITSDDDTTSAMTDATTSETKQERDPVYFTENPYDFNPQGVVRYQYDGNDNGMIIKWFLPNSKILIFEWDENKKYDNGSHYHIGTHDGSHYYPGEVVPEPWASAYFPR